ncbi:MAG TPA: SoxY-related AACIE arm protein [Burkholderiales bacterium]|nr:SoxY-related AACIE arm protein [Burkholderiales bacterium]
MISRRAFLLILGSGPAFAQLPPNITAERQAALRAAIRKATSGAAVRAGKVTISIPPLIDNGNTVPISVTVDSPMTEADHVKAIHLFTEKNPQPYVLTAHLGPRAGRARVDTRARIADTGQVIAIAQLSDGSYWSDTVSVVVTLSACLEDGLI